MTKYVIIIIDGGNASSEDDDRTWAKDLKKQYRQIRKETKFRNRNGEPEDEEDAAENGVPANGEPAVAAAPSHEFKVKSLRTKINKYVDSYH